MHAVPDVYRPFGRYAQAFRSDDERRRVGLVPEGIVVEDAGFEEITQAITGYSDPCGALTLARDHPQAQSGRSKRGEHRLDTFERPDQRVVVLVVVRAIGGEHFSGE